MLRRAFISGQIAQLRRLYTQTKFLDQVVLTGLCFVFAIALLVSSNLLLLFLS